MDSHLVAGVGNIYANEALFRAKINPACRRAHRARSLRHPGRQDPKTLTDDRRRQLNLRDTSIGAGFFRPVFSSTARAGGLSHARSAIRSLVLSQRATFYCRVARAEATSDRR
jgi:formamidopyrimidine-DNA glycosylase